MGTAPAFQLYAADFYMDTGDWSNEEIGLYFRMLMHEWVNGPLQNDTARLCRIGKVSRKKYLSLSEFVLCKFTLVDGKLINKRLEAERKKQQDYREKQKVTGKKGADKKKELQKATLQATLEGLLELPITHAQALQSSSSSSLELCSDTKEVLKPSASADAAQDKPAAFYTTKKKRKLNGHKFGKFMEFWEAFAYQKGKAEAADAWLDIEGYSEELVIKIIGAAKTEAFQRSILRSKGVTPKMAQGWISGKRWEDKTKEEESMPDDPLAAFRD
jgi:uncharacterized protein YdaU (DUF1376 family)